MEEVGGTFKTASVVEKTFYLKSSVGLGRKITFRSRIKNFDQNQYLVIVHDKFLEGKTQRITLTQVELFVFLQLKFGTFKNGRRTLHIIENAQDTTVTLKVVKLDPRNSIIISNQGEVCLQKLEFVELVELIKYSIDHA